MNMRTRVAAVSAGLAFAISLTASLSAAQDAKQWTYLVGPKAVVSVSNDYGPITVKAAANGRIVVSTISRSNSLNFSNEQRGNRIELRSNSAVPGDDQGDYSVLVPEDVFVSLQSSGGLLQAQGLRGDVLLEAITGPIQANDLTDAHLHVKTLNGAVNLTAIHRCTVEVSSISGDVHLRDVDGPRVVVNSGSGRIVYEGDPGPAGDYRLTSHSGDLEVSIPATALVDVKSHSMTGPADEDFPDHRGGSGTGHSLLKPGISSASRFVLRSFRGKIHLRRP
jgi:hypothetical protein